MSMNTCPKCGKVYDTDFQMEMIDDEMVCNECYEKWFEDTEKKASEIFESLLCNPDGDIAIIASNYDKKLLKAGIEKVKELEWSENFHREAAHK